MTATAPYPSAALAEIHASLSMFAKQLATATFSLYSDEWI